MCSFVAAAHAESAEQLEVRFLWELGDGFEPALKLAMPKASLLERDPAGVSLLSAKMRFQGSNSFDFAADGPGDDECMCARLTAVIFYRVP